LDLIVAIGLATFYNSAAHMGAAYWIAAFWVPALLVTHYVTFVLLLRARGQLALAWTSACHPGEAA
jgi:hypothetical protein